MNNKVVTRFAPSPTGTLHTGGARTALINYIFAKQNGGQYILRIDDTDKARSTKEYEAEIINDLHWLGIEEDAGYHQSERLDRHKAFLQKLIDENKAYVSKEENVAEGQSPEVIRFRNPNKTIVFQDLIRGEVKVDTSDLGDFIIAKDLDTPLYHFASIVDDFELGVTHVIRAEEHLPNTPRQILMWEAIGAPLPQFAHLPLILAPDRSKLSKRLHADIAAISEFIKKGYLPEALINYMAFLGWNPGTDKELYSLEELIADFDLARVQKAGAIFNQEKLDWYDHEYLKRLSLDDLYRQTKPFLAQLEQTPGYDEERLKMILPLILERINKFGDIGEMLAAGELQYFFTAPSYPKELLKTQDHLNDLIKLVADIDENNFTAETVKAAIWDFATERGRGNVLWPMRVALSGLAKSPDPFIIASIIGKAETIKRLTNAANL